MKATELCGWRSEEQLSSSPSCFMAHRDAVLAHSPSSTEVPAQRAMEEKRTRGKSNLLRPLVSKRIVPGSCSQRVERE
eukprot:466440-Hanusia_phi.AAC.5